MSRFNKYAAAIEERKTLRDNQEPYNNQTNPDSDQSPINPAGYVFSPKHGLYLEKSLRDENDSHDENSKANPFYVSTPPDIWVRLGTVVAALGLVILFAYTWYTRAEMFTLEKQVEVSERPWLSIKTAVAGPFVCDLPNEG
jgi:hypothetical protein